ncbi:MAG: hypothetical protein AAF693_03600 [Bacteroidota bacterium]
MKTITSVILTVLATYCGAQPINEERMDRDLEVAENILSTLMKTSDRNVIFYTRPPYKGTFVEGYGVIFNATRRIGSRIVSSTSKGDVVYDVPGQASGTTVISGYTSSKSGTEDNENNRTEWIENMKTFLIDYADLIGQLKPEHKIMISPEGGGSTYGGWDSFEIRTNGSAQEFQDPTLEVTKKDLTDFKLGKISRDELSKRIKIIEPPTKENVAQDVELLASILQRLYKSDLSDTYYVSGRVNYGMIPEFGVVFNMRVYSSSREQGLHRIVTQKRGGLTQEERDKLVKEMYPNFINELKKNVVQYGRTVKSLASNEMMLLKVRLTECKGCGIPEKLELSIKASDLKAYDSGKIIEPTAIGKITVKEIGKQ